MMVDEKEDRYPFADTWPKKGSSGTGGTFGYSVEARYANSSPREIAGQLLDTRWKRIQMQRSPIGVPQRASPYNPAAYGLHEWAAAQALRWWFVAAAEMADAFCVETRIVKHRITYSYSNEAISAHSYVGGEDRSNIMPDWSKAEPDVTPVPADGPVEP